MVTINIAESIKLYCEQSAFVAFPYNNNIVAILREQKERYWHAENKVWEIPAKCVQAVIEKICKYDDITITGQYYGAAESVDSLAAQLPENFVYKTVPYEHQKEGVVYGINHSTFLLGDEQGLGKTKQVIDIAVARKLKYGYKHCLIVCCVNGLKWNWYKEVKTHSNEDSWILGSRFKSGKHIIGTLQDRLTDLNNLDKLSSYFLITNVETIRDDTVAKKLKQLCDNGTISMIAVDEVHKCKNPTTQQAKALLKLMPETRIAMTGTPIMNKPLDVYTSLKWLGVESHPFYQFKNHYCVFGGFGGKEVQGYKNLAEIREKLSNNMLRRLKKEVLDLPEKLHINEYVEMSKDQSRIYNLVYESIQSEIDKIKASSNPLAMLIRLRQATGYTGILSSTVATSAKLDRMEELVADAAESGTKCLIFSNWTAVTDPACARLRKYNPAVITGETKDEQRKEEEYRFMNDPNCGVAVGTIGAMGTGLTLTAATTVIFLDEPWNRANKEQAEDRAHRIGTKSNVSIITIMCKDTIDERIHELVIEKGEMADMLVDGKVASISSNDIDFLLS